MNADWHSSDFANLSPYYLQKYGTALYGLNKLYLLMEKQHNRGQDGAGVASVKLEYRTRSSISSPHTQQ